MIESHPVNPEGLCRARYGTITRLHDYFRRVNGVIDMEFSQDFFPFTTICTRPNRFDVAPPILLIGNQSDQFKLFNQHWAEGTHTTSDPELERQAAYGYEYAVEEGMYCEECEAIVHLPDGKRFVPYLRYIAPYRDPGGRELIAYASINLSPTFQ